MKKNLIQIIFAVLSISIVTFTFIYFPSAQTLRPSELGVVSFISSLATEAQKQEAALKAKDAGFGWFREEYTYSDPMNYAPYNAAYQQFSSADLNILGLLTYGGPDVSHTKWQNYVSEVVKNYPKVKAWEIMNEADNYLSAADYVVYLKEARAAIKAQSDAMVICSGLTARMEAYDFWDEIKKSGGWDDCDALGLHIYHIGDPTQDNGGGTLSKETQVAVDSVNANGSDKKIWVTEFGYNSQEVGAENQADWLVQSLSIFQEFDEIERIFIYRLYDHSDGFGVVGEDLAVKESFTAIKDWLASGAPSLVTRQTPPKDEMIASAIDKEKSLIRLDGKNVPPDGETPYRVVVEVQDKDGNLVKDQKPSIVLDGGQTETTDFVLVGNEWFSYVTSIEKGEKTAQIKVGETELGTVKMIFGATETKPVTQPTVITPTVTNQPSTISPTTTPASTQIPERSRYAIFIFLGIELLIISSIILVVLKLIQKFRGQL